ncbi:glycoside hydrolase family 28 protein [Bacteroides stercorirosoris]|jgi:polygalacturonase|uniref:Glycoside hydrolase family 28 protein n=2 Tax=Bacteroides stercorirosoris TaxID=871324 RepID=A0A413HAN4_9BACE|nr:glycoside hydrolase family 28 protein [Bacteroides stercorirosoris]RGX80773.1 glycoside hydrolase family 28 protein [Bacteroides stercorirosoris]
MKIYFIRIVLVLLMTCLSTNIQSKGIPDFFWMKQVGAVSYPAQQTVYNVTDYGAKGDAICMNTKAIQKAIDEAEQAGGGMVVFSPGIYLTGSLFVGNNVNLHISKGVTLVGSQDIVDYKKIDTRIAGIEMEWPSALINIIGKKNAAISGDGVINGRGKIFWDKYWNMRKDYEMKGLRWIVDYDCERPRGILIAESENVTVRDIVLYQPGFWSLHVLYSKHITIDGIIISNNIEGHGPSTDGIDIDSSEYVLVQNSNINCNDDNFCLKAGRDNDGLRVNRPCQYVVIRDCIAGSGGGMFTCGSETSGGIRNIVAYRMKGIGTKCGLRFKSTCQRGGVIENIYLYDIEMVEVARPIVVDLNWNPAYSTSKLPEGYDIKKLPAHWLKMLEPVSLAQGTPAFRNISLDKVTASNAQSCINVVGIADSRIENFVFHSVCLKGDKAGKIVWAKDWRLNDVRIEASNDLILECNENVVIP